jgi:hypothetical protein
MVPSVIDVELNVVLFFFDLKSDSHSQECLCYGLSVK